MNEKKPPLILLALVATFFVKMSMIIEVILKQRSL